MTLELANLLVQDMYLNTTRSEMVGAKIFDNGKMVGAIRINNGKQSFWMKKKYINKISAQPLPSQSTLSLQF